MAALSVEHLKVLMVEHLKVMAALTVEPAYASLSVTTWLRSLKPWEWIQSVKREALTSRFREGKVRGVDPVGSERAKPLPLIHHI